jgi:ribonucleoside-diphosphate reductase alpha chain
MELSPINATCSEEEDALTRMTSTALRHGTDIHMVVQQLEKVKGGMHCFAKSMARALKKYIPDGTKEDGVCTGCEGVGCLIRQEGCITCVQCGFSACI